jgi:hypothetical protein
MEYEALFAIACFALTAWYAYRSADTIREAIEAFRDVFRGGPPPTHPATAGDQTPAHAGKCSTQGG